MHCSAQSAGVAPLLAGHPRLTAPPSPPPPHAACLPCLQFGMKRQVVGIWKCKACNKTQAGGAYVLK